MKYIIALLTIIATNSAFASFIETCDFLVEVKNMETVVAPSAETPVYSAKMDVTVLEAKNSGPSHVSCTVHVNQDRTIKVESADLLALAQTAVGHKINIHHLHYNSSSPNGIISVTRDNLINKGNDALAIVLRNDTVNDLVGKVIADLGVGSDKVVLLASTAQFLPEGLCGFVGCSSTYLVTLTYGQDFMNSQRTTIVTKVTVGPLNDNTLDPVVQILDPQ